MRLVECPDLFTTAGAKETLCEGLSLALEYSGAVKIMEHQEIDAGGNRKESYLQSIGGHTMG